MWTMAVPFSVQVVVYVVKLDSLSGEATDEDVALALSEKLELAPVPIGATTEDEPEADPTEAVEFAEAVMLGLELVLIDEELKLSVMLPDTELETPVVTGAEWVWTTAVPFSVQVVVYVVKLDSLDNEADEVVALTLLDRLELTPVPLGAAEDVRGAVPERLVELAEPVKPELAPVLTGETSVELALGVMLADTDPVMGAE